MLTKVVPEIANERQAKEKFQEAQNLGKALLVVVNKELAEHYVESLARADLQAEPGQGAPRFFNRSASSEELSQLLVLHGRKKIADPKKLPKTTH